MILDLIFTVCFLAVLAFVAAACAFLGGIFYQKFSLGSAIEKIETFSLLMCSYVFFVLLCGFAFEVWWLQEASLGLLVSLGAIAPSLVFFFCREGQKLDITTGKTAREYYQLQP